ncbi:MAG: rRNA adenine dimethyltransferase family protein [Candidatus Peregrinibacteria bacterium]
MHRRKLKTQNSRLKTQDSRLTIVQGNALHAQMPETPYKVVANIPYHITSPLLRHLFLESKKTPASLTLLIQREVAERICQAPAKTLSDPERAKRNEGESKGIKGNASMLTILVGLFGRPKIVARVPPAAFLPPPKVDSAVLHIACFPEPLADANAIECLFKLTKIAFGQKRKMLRNTLGTFHGGLERLAGLHIEPTRRPQTLSVQEWIALAKAWPDDQSA